MRAPPLPSAYPAPDAHQDLSPEIQAARRTLDLAGRGLGLLDRCVRGPAFASALDALGETAARGRVIVTGMGKSGHIARKIAATLASTGTPSLFVHPAEAAHGDLGMIQAGDAILALSNSGETAELAVILDHAKRFALKLVAITGRAGSTLALAADAALILPDVPEACPNGLAPTTSTTLTLALGDALAVALLSRSGFSAADFRDLHPAGRLGQRLRRVADLMHKAPDLPLVGPDTGMPQAILEMSSRRFGCVGVVDDAGQLVGIFTDGDLRRHLSKELLDRAIAEVMTPSPRTIAGDALASTALAEMQARAITVLFVVAQNRPVGLIHIHDLLQAGIA